MSLLCVCGCVCVLDVRRYDDELCPFWQAARSIFTVLLCCVFFFDQINTLSLSGLEMGPAQ